MIQIQQIDPELIGSFSPVVQAVFGATCQYIDWLFLQADAPNCAMQHRGSESWSVGGGKVLVKALPWDARIGCLSGLCPRSTEGVAVLLRNEFLTAQKMQDLWEALGDAYHPCPPFDLFCVLACHDDKPFQIVCAGLGNGCDLLSLPGVDAGRIGERVRAGGRSDLADGEIDAATGQLRSQAPFCILSMLDDDVLSGVLRDIIARERILASATKERTKRAAAHESGHIVLAHNDRRSMKHGAYIDPDTGEGGCSADVPDWDGTVAGKKPVKRSIMGLLGGAIAEWVLLGKVSHRECGNDYARTDELAGQIEQTEAQKKCLVTALMECTMRTLSRPANSARLQAVQAALIASPILREQQVRDVIDAATTQATTHRRGSRTSEGWLEVRDEIVRLVMDPTARA